MFGVFQHFFIYSSLVAGAYVEHILNFITNKKEILLDNIHATAALRHPSFTQNETVLQNPSKSMKMPFQRFQSLDARSSFLTLTSQNVPRRRRPTHRCPEGLRSNIWPAYSTPYLSFPNIHKRNIQTPKVCSGDRNPSILLK